MVSEEQFVEKVVLKERERCSECGSLKDAWGFCMTCLEDRRRQRRESLQDDATIFGDEFFIQILDWLELYMEPEDVFSEPTLNDWAVRNGWVPEEEYIEDNEITKSDVDAVFAEAKKNIAILRESTEKLGGKDSDNLITRVYAEMADAMDNLADAVYGLVGEDEDETE